VDIGADVGLIKPYYTGHDGNPDMRKLTHPWLAALLRASVWVSDSTDLAFSGRLGVAQPFWDDRASSLVVVYGAGPEIRHWVSQQIAVGGELDVARAQLELGERGTDSGVHANGLVVSPSVRITWAL
jgi:hypothetical protein